MDFEEIVERMAMTKKKAGLLPPHKQLPHATHKGILRIGDLEIPCFVLDDGRRVISGRGMTAAIGMKGRGQGIARIASHRMLESNKNKGLALAIQTPISFTGGPPKGGIGYEAPLLQELSEAILSARDDGLLRTDQERRYGQYADMLIRAFARVGIIALIDECTGYDEVRDRRALQEILDKYLLAEQAKWAKRFPDDFYKEIFRLRGWEWKGMKVNRPQVVGRYTNDIVWDRLAPGVREELEKLNPKDASGKRATKHHQWLTDDIGHPALQNLLTGVMAILRGSLRWEDFKKSLQRSYPKINANNPSLPLDDDEK